MAIASINPATGQVLKTFEPLSDTQIQKKLQLAADTFPKFRKLSFAERGRMMARAGEILESEKEALGRPARQIWTKRRLSWIPKLEGVSEIEGQR